MRNKIIRARNKKRAITKILSILCTFLVLASGMLIFSDRGSYLGGNMLKTLEYIEINGQRQCISIRSNDEKLPLLLYIHGGPGDAALPLVNKYNKALEDEFTVVVWEQRGAGKSFYPFAESDDLSMQTFVDDMDIIVNLLLDRYDQSKIYLVAHSWGTVLGLKYIQLHPELVYAYIGCGQVVNMAESVQRQYDFVVHENEAIDNKKILERLHSIDTSYTQDNWLNDLLFVTKQAVKHKSSLYGKTNYNRFVRDFILSPDYSLKDLINREKGSLQSLKYFWPELMSTNFENNTVYEVPVIFIEGRYDQHVSSTLAKEYYDTLETDKQFYWFEKSAHFPQWEEANKFNQIIIDLLKAHA